MSFTRELKNNIVNLYTRLYSLSHPIEKKILFDSFGGKQYSDSPRFICERMHELYPEYELVWVNNSTSDQFRIVPDYVKIIRREKLSFYQTLATSFCYVTNENINNNIYKRKNQFFIQTWHGDIPLKKIIYDVSDKLPYKIMDSKLDDLCISGSNLGESIYRSAFRYRGEVLKKGMPRNDQLNECSQEKVKIIKKRLGIEEEYKIVLYAPTYRDNLQSIQKSFVDLNRVVRKLEENGEKWCCITRAHSASKGIEYDVQSKILDLTNYPDMADLLLVSDLLLTDYSSCAGDFILKKKPVILLFFDQEEYNAKCRGFNFDPTEAGFVIAYSNDELIDILAQKDETFFAHNCEELIKYFGIIRNIDSAKDICDRIDSFYQKKY